MNRRRLLWQAFALSAIGPPRAHAAPPTPGSLRLGVLLFDRRDSWLWLETELRQALADLGWVQGQNLSLDWRYADGDPARLPELAAALARSGAHAILTRGTPATRALQQATQTVPIVTGVGDPVGGGFARSLARPGGNVTGLSYAVVETLRKQLELLREMVPRLARLTILFPANRAAFAREFAQDLESAARQSSIVPRLVFAGSAAELRSALTSDRGPGAHAAFIFSFGATIEPEEIALIALRAQVPTMFDQRSYVDAGGLMSYRLNWEQQTQRSAAQIDKLFRGEKAAQIAFELPTQTELVINARSAMALGLAIPLALLARADEVIR